ncbi:integral membrane protein [Lasiosphaeria ovina]|uniref:Integral membrane protein n=1 Tax=Lasiosphaeria ovina TaxID=92902 RepID=A0AAE0KFZ9_9PEZI|nr:integral membrane protein [Lasiosphaeria ovina]
MESNSDTYAADQRRQNDLVITTAVFTSLSVLIVTTRTFVRAVLIRRFGADDATILVALVFCIGYLAEVLLGRDNGIGHAMSTLSLDNMYNLIKITLAIQCTYYGAVNFIKFSILLMYLRFAVTATLRRACMAMIAFHSLFFIVSIVVTLAQCQPLVKMWDLTGSVDGKCINTTAFFYFTSGVNIITDIIIFALPIKTLMAINRPRHEKIALVSIFGIGTFATVVAIVRLHTIYTYTLATDPFQQSILVNVWSIIEINIAVICASAPALKPLFTPQALKSAREGSSPPKHSGYEYHSRDRSVMQNKISVGKSFATERDHDIHLGSIPSSSTKISGGKIGSDAASTEQILTD